jgi:hypothetical protein
LVRKKIASVFGVYEQAKQEGRMKQAANRAAPLAYFMLLSCLASSSVLKMGRENFLGPGM